MGLFPIILWIDAEISRKFIRLIPDFESWASVTVFEPTTDEFDLIQQTTEKSANFGDFPYSPILSSPVLPESLTYDLAFIPAWLAKY